MKEELIVLSLQQHRPFNDILLQSRYIGDKNVEFTAFSSKDLKTNRKRKKVISVSLPTKSIKSPYVVRPITKILCLG